MTRFSLAFVPRHIEQQVTQAWATSNAGLAVFRIVFATLALIVFLPATQALWTLEYPRVAATPPPGLMALMPDAVYSPVVVVALHVIVAIAMGLVLVGWRTAWSSLVAATAWVVLMGVAYSFGKISHSLMLALVPALLGPFWGRAWSLDSRRLGERPAMPPWVRAFGAWALAFFMFSAAVPKALSGWLDPSSGATQAILERQVVTHGRDGLLAGLAADIPWTPAIELMDWSAVLLEASLVVAVLSVRRFRFVLALLLTFHFAILLTMNIPFASNVVIYSLFAPLTAIAVYVERRASGLAAVLRRIGTRPMVLVGIGLGVPVSLALCRVAVTSREAEIAGIPLPLTGSSIIVAIGGLVGVSVLASRFRRRLRQVQDGPGVLIFDQDCGFCSRYASWAARRMRADRVAGFQSSPDLLRDHALSSSDCLDASWWVSDSERLRGHEAIAQSLVRIGGAHRVLGCILLLPVVSYLASLGYRLVAENRQLMPGAGDACDIAGPDPADPPQVDQQLA